MKTAAHQLGGARRRSLALIGTVIVVAAAAGSLSSSTADARSLARTGLSCPGNTERPFLRWVDPAPYVLAPGADFELRLSWAGSPGVKTVSGNESYNVHAPSDARSLYLPAGGSVVTPPICVGLVDPTLRFFAVGTGDLRVEVLYRTLFGDQSTTVAKLSTMRSWAPTLPVPFLANALGLTALDGLTTTVRFRFTAGGKGSWQIDDAYVDPWKVD